MSRFYVNGKETEAEGSRRLIDILRNDCHLKSVKDGCSEGACGTCTVLIDGKAVKSCIQTAEKVEGKHIVTVEGLPEKEMSVYVYAFGKAGAVQCGFCTPGMVMCAKGLLDQNPNPDRAEIARAVRGNICRCTGYKKIIDAVELAAEIFRGDRDMEEEKKTAGIGESIRRIDAEEKVRGTGEYVDDMEIEGMVFAGALRSPYPRAKILSIDTAEAKALPGVIDVLELKDIPGNRHVGHIVKDWDVLLGVGDITHFLGDAVCIVVAETEEILEQAKKLVRAEYEELTPCTSPAMSLAEDAPELHRSGNIASEEHLVRGDADSAIAGAAYVVTEHFETPWNEHAYLEPECAIAMPYRDGVFIYSSDQGAHSVREEVAYMLGLPEDQVVVENRLVGGGFGGREDAVIQPVAALAAYCTKRTVKVKFTRQESLLMHPKRHPFSIDITLACDEDGHILAIKEKNIADTGAYASLAGPVLQRACIHASGPYKIANMDIEGKAVYTNNPPAGAFRGFGVTQTAFALETCMNLLAEKVGISEWEIRWRNAVRPGDRLPNGQIANQATALTETLLAVKDVFESSPYAGIACAIKNSGVGVGLPDIGRCRLAVEGGKVHIYAGATCIGQGLATVLLQMVCETTGLSAESVVWHFPNTETCPDSGTTSGSRQTTVTGEAARRAAEKLKAAMEGKTLSELEGQEFYGEYYAKTDKITSTAAKPVFHVAYGYMTQVCILNEDGTVGKLVSAVDCGRAVNPVMLEGQIEGGAVMSMGYCLTEAYPLDNGRPLAKFGTLGLFRADKVPPVESIIIEKEGTDMAYGAKGIGEITSIPTAPAISGAYYRKDHLLRTSIPLANTPYSRKKPV